MKFPSYFILLFPENASYKYAFQKKNNQSDITINNIHFNKEITFTKTV